MPCTSLVCPTASVSYPVGRLSFISHTQLLCSVFSTILVGLTLLGHPAFCVVALNRVFFSCAISHGILFISSVFTTGVLLLSRTLRVSGIKTILKFNLANLTDDGKASGHPRITGSYTGGSYKDPSAIRSSSLNGCAQRRGLLRS